MKTSNYLFLVLPSSFDSVGISNCSFIYPFFVYPVLLLLCANQSLAYRKFKVIASASEAPGIFRNPQLLFIRVLFRSPCPFGFSFHPITEQLTCQWHLPQSRKQILPKLTKSLAELASKDK